MDPDFVALKKYTHPANFKSRLDTSGNSWIAKGAWKKVKHTLSNGGLMVNFHATK